MPRIESDVDRMLRAAKTVHSDLWKRTEDVARIIAPAVFLDDWVIDPPERAAMFALKLKYQRAVAMHTAQQVLAFLGVNTETDWLAVLEDMVRGE